MIYITCYDKVKRPFVSLSLTYIVELNKVIITFKNFKSNVIVLAFLLGTPLRSNFRHQARLKNCSWATREPSSLGPFGKRRQRARTTFDTTHWAVILPAIIPPAECGLHWPTVLQTLLSKPLSYSQNARTHSTTKIQSPPFALWSLPRLPFCCPPSLI